MTKRMLFGAAIVLMSTVPAFAQTLTFTTTATAPAGTPIHVTVYDNANVAVPPADVTWTGLPVDASVTPDATGFSFTRTNVGTFNATAKKGIATGIMTLNFTAPPLKFTSP